MKAAVIYESGGPAVLRYQEVPDPVCPNGFVVVDVEAISIEGGDLLARAAGKPAVVPHIVGYLCAGTVRGRGRRRGTRDRRPGGRREPGGVARRETRGSRGHDLADPR